MACSDEGADAKNSTKNLRKPVLHPDLSTSRSKWLCDLDAARAGDRDALGKLLQSHWSPLWKQATVQIDESLQGKQAASDLIQETFFDAQRCFQDFRGSTPGELHAWLKTILSNNVQDVWRQYAVSQKRQISLELPLASDERDVKKNGSESGSPSALFQKQERIVAVQRVLNAMPAHYAMVIRLRHWEALSFETIAAKMEKTPDAVRQLWYRALELFTERMLPDESR